MRKLTGKHLAAATAVFCAFVAVIYCYTHAAAGQTEAPLELASREVSLGRMDPGIIAESLTVSPDSRRVAYVAQRGRKQLVVVDGVEGAEYDGIGEGTPIFSPNGGRVAYIAQRGRKWLVVVDGVEGAEYDGIGQRHLIFSPDGGCVAYTAQRGRKQLVVVDGVEGDEYDIFLRGSELVFDGAGQLHALAVRNGEIFHLEIRLVQP